MGKVHKPRSGSMAYYPRKKAKKETPSFSTFPELKETKTMNFLGYKSGMLQISAKNDVKKSVGFGQEQVFSGTVIECPPMQVFGIRLYHKTTEGNKVLDEALTEKTEKHLSRKINSISKKKKKHSIEELEKKLEEAEYVSLLVHTKPYETGTEKKKPEVSEIRISGKKEEQFKLAKEKLGKELKIKDVFSENQFIDVKAVTKGKGMQGVIKRFGVKMGRPKAKKRRIVGAISPWTPATVMYTVARPGQMGYHSRTEYNKKIMLIGEGKELNEFKNYGKIKNDFILVAGSIPGPAKRCVALRCHIREPEEKKMKVVEVKVLK
ncbi:50S ribosomal protein L3 [Candidatus Micrarchaeota archaeon]|nr:50S ribosomal protein L3 [Candidatus Micrarchaeota archaeon]MBU2476674.1 50S ribosomal protein L3 [Candidatus Micrarchaeota archaeon]